MATGPSSSSATSSFPRTIQDIFNDYSGRRTGVILALTQEADQLFQECDPVKEEVCLYGHPNGTWEVSPPPEMIPPKTPEPYLGINSLRDKTERKEWIKRVAAYAEGWLMSLAIFYGAMAELSRNGRSRLFGLINELPAVSEVVRAWPPADMPSTDHSSEASGSEPRSSGVKRSSDGKSTSTENIIEESSEEDDVRCGSCGFVNKGNEFWIKCDVCELWYHGKCVGITPAVADNIGKYECPSCENKRTGLKSTETD